MVSHIKFGLKMQEIQHVFGNQTNSDTKWPKSAFIFVILWYSISFNFYLISKCETFFPHSRRHRIHTTKQISRNILYRYFKFRPKRPKKAKNRKIGIFSDILKHLNSIEKIIVWFVWIPGLLECGKMASHVEFG